MDEFSKGLKVSIESVLGQGKPVGYVNPLVVIGLTEAMLDLRLTDEQMYAIVRSYSRQLARQVHPDAQAQNVSSDRQREILLAFDTLDDRDKFAEVLAEFRALKSSDRSEINLLRTSLSNAKESLNSFQQKELRLSQGLENLAREKFAFEIEREANRVGLETLNKHAIMLRNHIQWAENLAADYKRTAAGLRVICKNFDSYMWRLSLASTSPDAVGIHAFNAKWVAFATLVPAGFSKKAPNPLTKRSRPTAGFQRALDKLGISKEMTKQLVVAWKSAKEMPYTFPEKGFKSTYSLKLHLFSLKEGQPSLEYGWERTSVLGRVMGCISESDSLVTRRHLTHLIDTDQVLSKITPFLFPNSVLVCGRAREMFDEKGLKTLIVSFETKRVILGVG